MTRIVNAYLDLAELRANEHIPMSMEDWAEQFEGFLRMGKKEILTNAGSISVRIAEELALSEYPTIICLTAIWHMAFPRTIASTFGRLILRMVEFYNCLADLTKDVICQTFPEFYQERGDKQRFSIAFQGMTSDFSPSGFPGSF